MIGHSIRLPGEYHQVLRDRLDRLVREILTTPDVRLDCEAAGETVEIRIMRRPATKVMAP